MNFMVVLLQNVPYLLSTKINDFWRTNVSCNFAGLFSNVIVSKGYSDENSSWECCMVLNKHYSKAILTGCGGNIAGDEVSLTEEDEKELKSLRRVADVLMTQ